MEALKIDSPAETAVTLRVLIYSSRSFDAEMIVGQLTRTGFDPCWQMVNDETAYTAGLDDNPEIVFVADAPPEIDPMRALTIVQERGIDIPVIVITGTSDDESTAVECMERGAADYLVRDRPARLGQAIARALERKTLGDQKHQAEQALQESDDLYRTVVENSSDAIAIYAGIERVYVNPAFLKLFGIEDLSQALAYPVDHFLVPEHREMVNQAMLARVRGEPVADVYEFRIMRTDGQVRTVQSAMAEITYKGQPAGLATTRDVTGRRKTEDDLREAQEYARNLIDSSLDMIISVDWDRRIVEFNQAAQSTFGYSRQEILGKSIDILYADPKEGRKLHESACKSGQYSMEVTNARKNGETFVSFVASSALKDPHGELIGVMGISRDVSELRNTEHTRSRLIAILEATTDYVGIADAKGVMIYLNGAAREMLGIEEDYDLGRLEHYRVHPNWAGELIANVAIPTARDRGVWSGEAAFRDQSGIEIPVDMVLIRQQSPDGELLGYATVSRDISERNRSRERLQRYVDRLEIQSQIEKRILDADFGDDIAQGAIEQLRQLVPFKRASVTTFDEENDLATAVAVHFGEDYPLEQRRLFPLTETLGQIDELRDGFPRVVPNIQRLPEDSPDSQTILVKTLRAEGIRALAIVPLRGHTGLIGSLNMGAEEVGAFTNEHIEIAAQVADQLAVAIEQTRLHDQVQRHAIELEHQVAERTAELRAIQWSMTEGLLVIAQDGTFRYVNRAATDFLGFFSGEIEGRSTEEVFRLMAPDIGGPDTAETLISIVQGTTSLPSSVELSVTRPHRRELVATAFAIPLRRYEKMVGLLLRDITEERELERRRDSFVSVASHEIRTPLAVLKGFSELLLERSLPEAKRRDCLERIQRSSHSLTTIVDELLNVSRIQSGELELNLEPLDIGGIIQEVVATVKPITDKHDFMLKVDPNIPWVLADSDKLSQVLINLVDNAVKYSPVGGQVTFTVVEESDKNRVVVAVADQGIGIAPQEQPHVFETFYRERKPETMGIRGSGLGLYIVGELMKLMHGQVWLDSEPGIGSTFFVSFPAVNGGSSK